jgi:hypothetical protein
MGMIHSARITLSRIRTDLRKGRKRFIGQVSTSNANGPFAGRFPIRGPNAASASLLPD